MQIPARIPYSLSVIYPAGLFVGMRIFDLTSGIPVQVTGLAGMVGNVLPLTNIVASHTYVTKFTGADQSRYVFVFNTYVDGTYAVIDYGNPEISRDAYCSFIAPVLVQGLRIEVGCADQPRQIPVTVSQISDANLLLSFFDEQGGVIDVSEATLLQVQVLEADGVTVLSKAATPVAGAPNQALAAFLAADLALLPAGDNDVQIRLTLAGVAYVANLYSAISVEPQIA